MLARHSVAEVEVALRTLLLETPEVAALVGDRIAPLMLPEEASLPALTYVVVFDNPDEHQEGASGISTTNIQFSAWAIGTEQESGYSATRRLAKAVRRALLGRRFTAEGIEIQAVTGGAITTERPEVETDVWHTFIEFEVIARSG